MLKQPQTNIFHTIIEQDSTLFEAGLFERVLQFRFTDYKSINGHDVYTGTMSKLSPKMLDQFVSLEYVLEFMSEHKTVRFDRGKQNVGIILIYRIDGVFIDQYQMVSLQKSKQIQSSHYLQHIIHTSKQQGSFDDHTIKQCFQFLAMELQILKWKIRENEMIQMSKQGKRIKKQGEIIVNKENELQRIEDLVKQQKQHTNLSSKLSHQTIKQINAKYQQKLTQIQQQIATIHLINNTFITNAQHQIKTINNNINKLTYKIKAQTNKYQTHIKIIYNQSVSAINRQANSFRTCIQQNYTKYKHQIERYQQQFQTNHQNHQNQLNSLKNSIISINQNIYESQKVGQENSFCSHKKEIDVIQKDIKSMKKVIRQQFQQSKIITDSMHAQNKTKTENMKDRKDDRKP